MNLIYETWSTDVLICRKFEDFIKVICCCDTTMWITAFSMDGGLFRKTCSIHNKRHCVLKMQWTACSEIPTTLKGVRVEIQWISGPAEELLASQGGLNSMALVGDTKGAVWSCLSDVFCKTNKWLVGPINTQAFPHRLKSTQRISTGVTELFSGWSLKSLHQSTQGTNVIKQHSSLHQN